MVIPTAVAVGRKVAGTSEASNRSKLSRLGEEACHWKQRTNGRCASSTDGFTEVAGGLESLALHY